MLVMARWMRDAGHHVDVVVPAGTPAWQQGLDWGLSMVSAPPISKIGGKRHAGVWARGMKADVIWIRDRRDLEWAGHLANSLGAALVMQQAMQIPRPKKMPWHLLRYRRVDAWVTGLEWLKRECITKTPISEHRCHVLPLPLDERWFTTKAVAKNEAQQALELKLPEDVFLMGTVGRLDVGKGQRDALRALAQLPPHVHWLFVGDNTTNNDADEHRLLRETARELGVTSRSHFIPGQPDVLPVYDALDGFAMTSTAETIGTVTLEAMARRVPVIGTDAGGTSEILAEGRGLLYPPGDADALAESIQALTLTSPEAQASAIDQAHDYVQSCRPQHLVPAWNELLDLLVQSRRKA